jgi:hypothetical protein
MGISSTITIQRGNLALGNCVDTTAWRKHDEFS